MNPSLAFSTLHYDSSPGDRPAMGWNFLKWTVHLYIPLSIWLGYLYAGRFFKKVWRPEKLEDIAILALLPLCFMDYYKFRYSVLVKLIGIGVCAYAIYQQRYRARFLTEVLPWLLAALVTIQMLFFAPYSRSFLLPAIPPLVLLIAQRMKGKAFWVACALITFIPMFNYFEVRGTAPYLRVSSRGYYRALIEQVSADYNDYGLQSSTYMLFSFP